MTQTMNTRPLVAHLAGLAAAGMLAVTAVAPTHVSAAEGGEVHRHHWTFAGMFGTFDNAQLQRGFQVYKEVCSNCHGLSRISFRNLAEKGGPEFPVEGVRSLAESYKVEDGPNDDGKMFQRPGRLSDRIPPPYKNEAEARSIHNGAYPPDLSLIAKARNIEYAGPIWYHPLAMLKDIVAGYQEGGADYVHGLITSYREAAPAYRREGGRLIAVADKDVKDEKSVERCVSVDSSEAGKPHVCSKMGDGMNYNMVYPGHQIAMAAPLQDGIVAYGDGTPATIEQYAEDVAAFLSWTADPTLEQRKRLGWQVMLYLLVTAVLLYFGKRAIWRDLH